MPKSVWFAGAVSIVFTIACCREGVVREPCSVITLEQGGKHAIAVMETSVRSDEIALPLSEQQKEPLFQYLEAGGNRHVIGEDITIPDARQRYAGLLAALASPDNLDLEDLPSPTYANWFKTAAITQVIDAREADPAVPGTVRALTDGRFWWVFKRKGNGKFDRLVVFVTLGDNR